MMNTELEQLFLREDLLDTTSYLMVAQKIANLKREKYMITRLHFDKNLSSCQLNCDMNVFFQDTKTMNNFLELIDYLELQVGLLQKIEFSWIPQGKLNLLDDKEITVEVGGDGNVQIFLNFNILDRDYFNYP